MKHLNQNLFKVKIPFVDRIDLQDTSNSRIFPMFLDMVRGFAAFKWKQRTFDCGGYLLAEIEDFERAKRLFEAQKENTVTKMNENERQIIQYIASKGKCTINDISIYTGIKYQSVKRALVGRKDWKSFQISGMPLFLDYNFPVLYTIFGYIIAAVLGSL